MSSRRDMVMLFTCARCETRSAKSLSRQAYEKGVVLVRCPGCEGLHLVADRLGWFGTPGDVSDFLAARGEEVLTAVAPDGTLNLTPELLHGWTPAPSQDRDAEGDEGGSPAAALPPGPIAKGGPP